MAISGKVELKARYKGDIKIYIYTLIQIIGRDIVYNVRIYTRLIVLTRKQIQSLFLTKVASQGIIIVNLQEFYINYQVQRYIQPPIVIEQPSGVKLLYQLLADALTASRHIYAFAILLQYKVINGLRSSNKLDDYFHTGFISTLLSIYFSNLGPYYMLLDGIYIGRLVKS